MVANSEYAFPTPPVIHLIGDSTMADKCTLNDKPGRGWGQLLPEFFQSTVRIANHARDGRSSKSFAWEGLWDKALKTFQPGDWLVIQFGHNDQELDRPLLCTDPDSSYAMFLSRFVREARAKGTHPVFATSIHRRKFDDDGRLLDTLGDYPPAMRRLALELGVPLIDLHQETRGLLESLGSGKSKHLFLHLAPGKLPAYPLGIADNTLLSEAGARAVATLFAQETRMELPDLACWLLPTTPRRRGEVALHRFI